MRYRGKKLKRRKALTLLEMVIAMAIITVVFSSVLPLFRSVQVRWDARRGGTETIQSGRIAMEQLNRSIAESEIITMVSDSSNTDGYIEFIDNVGTTMRCDLAANNYIQFGPVGSQSELAGPVTSLKFTCYGLEDMDTVTTNIDLIRFVRVDADFVNSASSGSDKSFSTSAYLRTNGIISGTMIHSIFEFETNTLKNPRLVQIDTGHYLCAYEGVSDDGWATVLIVDTEGSWGITKGSSFEYDDMKGKTPSLTQIDSTHYLCAYSGADDDGWATVLTVNTGTWSITKETPFEFDSIQGKEPDLKKLDSTHYLCAYEGDTENGWATVLIVDTGTWEITKGSSFEFDNVKGKTPSLAQIDSTHYLCAYSGDGDDGWATVLTVDTGTWEITNETPFEYDSTGGKEPDLEELDSAHYLCVYSGDGDDGWATTLAVDTGDWTISTEDFEEFNEEGVETPRLTPISSNAFLCVYERNNGVETHDGWLNILTVNINTWKVSGGTPFEYIDDTARNPDVINITGDYYLSVYTGVGDAGCGVVIKIGSGSGMKP